MSENPSTVSSADGCMVHAGILASHGGNKADAKLTRGYKNAAYDKFIEEVIAELITPNKDPLPCGKPIPELDENLKKPFEELKNEEKFPDFHKNVMGFYKDIAVSLDRKSNYSFFPICDPVALGNDLFPHAPLKIEKLSDFMKFAIPNAAALAAEFGKKGVSDPVIYEKLGKSVPLTPAGLLAEFAKKAQDIGKPFELPTSLPITPTKDQLISGGSTLDSPYPPGGLPAEYVGPDWAAQVAAFSKNLPSFLPQLAAEMPAFLVQMISKGPAEALNSICGLVVDETAILGQSSNDANNKPQDIVMRAARKVLARKITEMTVIHVMAATIGSSKNGLVGIIAGPVNNQGQNSTTLTNFAVEIDSNGIVTFSGGESGKLPGTETDPDESRKKTDNLLAPDAIENLPAGEAFQKLGPTLPSSLAEREKYYDSATGAYKPAIESGVITAFVRYGSDQYNGEGNGELPGTKEYEEEINRSQKEEEEYQKSDKKIKDEQDNKILGGQIGEDAAKEVEEYKEKFDENTGEPPKGFAWAEPVEEEEIPQSPETSEPKVANPFLPRGYDLPQDPPPGPAQEPPIPPVPPPSPEETGTDPPNYGGGPPGENLSPTRAAIVSKANSARGLSYTRNRDQYSGFLFYTEYTKNPALAYASASQLSSCGIFARACYQSAGAYFIFNPKSGLNNYKDRFGVKDYIVDKETGKKHPLINTGNPKSHVVVGPSGNSEVSSVINKSIVLTDYFNEDYRSNTVITAFQEIARARGALKAWFPKIMPVIGAGDVLVIGGPEHVIVATQTFDPSNEEHLKRPKNGEPHFRSVEGGQTDGANIAKTKTSYCKEGRAQSTAIGEVYNYYLPPDRPDIADAIKNAPSSPGGLKKVYRQGTVNNAVVKGEVIVANNSRELRVVIDAERFINGSFV